MSPAAMAAAACSTSMTNEEPPTLVLSVYFGWMPRYSAIWRVGDQPADPALKMPSTSDSSIPASSRALRAASRSEEHTSELQSRGHLVCRLLLEKKKKT